METFINLLVSFNLKIFCNETALYSSHTGDINIPI